MVEEHHLTVVVERDLLRTGRYRWTLYHFGQAQDRSPVSFATRREAEEEAAKVLKKRVDEWKARSRTWGD